MNAGWRAFILYIMVATAVAGVILFGSANTVKLHEQDRKMHAGSTREPQSGDPAEAFLEIVLESSPLAQLSAGFTGIAPSMHLIRMASPRPLSNVDPIEHPARRRYGRIDFSFAFLVFMPIALIPVYFVIYRECVSKGDVQKLLAGNVSLFDFGVERILLPLLASGGFVAGLAVICLYIAGVRVTSNELLALIAIWGLTVAVYLLGWILLFAFLLLRSASFSSAIIQYAAIFLLLVFVLPQLMQSAALAIERPKGRLPLIVQRRLLAQTIRAEDTAAIDRFLIRHGHNALDWSQPLTKAQSLALVGLRIEEALAPRLSEFEASVSRLDSLSLALTWTSPYLVAQYAVDDLAGTGLARFSNFRTAAIQYHEEWRKYSLGHFARRQYLDYDALRNGPKFNFSTMDPLSTFMLVLPRTAYLGTLCLILAVLVRRELGKMLPRNRKTAR